MQRFEQKEISKIKGSEYVFAEPFEKNIVVLSSNVVLGLPEDRQSIDIFIVNENRKIVLSLRKPYSEFKLDNTQLGQESFGIYIPNRHREYNYYSIKNLREGSIKPSCRSFLPERWDVKRELLKYTNSDEYTAEYLPDEFKDDSKPFACKKFFLGVLARPDGHALRIKLGENNYIKLAFNYPILKIFKASQHERKDFFDYSIGRRWDYDEAEYEEYKDQLFYAHSQWWFVFEEIMQSVISVKDLLSVVKIEKISEHAILLSIGNQRQYVIDLVQKQCTPWNAREKGKLQIDHHGGLILLKDKRLYFYEAPSLLRIMQEICAFIPDALIVLIKNYLEEPKEPRRSPLPKVLFFQDRFNPQIELKKLEAKVHATENEEEQLQALTDKDAFKFFLSLPAHWSHEERVLTTQEHFFNEKTQRTYLSAYLLSLLGSPPEKLATVVTKNAFR